jgi:hypothetical protein
LSHFANKKTKSFGGNVRLAQPFLHVAHKNMGRFLGEFATHYIKNASRLAQLQARKKKEEAFRLAPSHLLSHTSGDCFLQREQVPNIFYNNIC